jgi:hypothetical protein
MSSWMLHAALTALLADTGAQAARVLDVRTGAVVAEMGTAALDDVPALIRLAAAARSVAAGADLDDLVLTTRRAVHVLRESSVPGFFLLIRLEEGNGDLVAARRGLASPALDAALRSVLRPPAGPPHSCDGTAPPADPPGGGEPALAALGPAAAWRRPGELAALALGPVAALPRRTSARPSGATAPAPAGSIPAADRPAAVPPLQRPPSKRLPSPSPLPSPYKRKPSPYKRQPGSVGPGGPQHEPPQHEPPQHEPPQHEPPQQTAPEQEPARESTPSVLKQVWADDMDTLRRLLAALRRPAGHLGS